MSRPLSVPRRFLRIAPEEVLFERRGFQCSGSAVRERLEASAASFVEGYHLALAHPSPPILAAHLEDVPQAFRGFAFEGAGMSLVLQDRLAVFDRRNVFQEFLAGPGNAHAYMLHVGAGWAVARLPWLRMRLMAEIAAFDPLLRWLVIDGFGFHEGFFHPRKTVGACAVPVSVRRGYARRAFDQGVGRSLWFVMGAGGERIAQAIARFDLARQSDLWSGVGLACGYAGGLSAPEISALAASVRQFLPEFAQGLAFAAKTRLRAGNPVPHTDLACRIVCGLSASDAAAITDRSLAQLEFGGSEPAWEIWRRRIQHECAGHMSLRLLKAATQSFT